jgi:hypothetical protein
MNIEIHRWLQEYEKHNSHHSHNNHTHHHDDDDDDDDLPIVYKIFAIAWILFMVVICYKADQREKEEQARRTERRRRRRHQRFLEIKLAPERRQAVVSAAIATRVSEKHLQFLKPICTFYKSNYKLTFCVFPNAEND